MLSESDIMKCLNAAGCYGNVKMTFESGPYCIDRPTINASRFAEQIESAATAPLLARIEEQKRTIDCLNEIINDHGPTTENVTIVGKLERELEEARKDAELLDYIQTNGATVELIPGAPDFYPMHFRVGGRYHTANESVRSAIRAAIKEQT